MENTELSHDGQIDYVGEELDLFQHAVNWKRYLHTRIKSYLKGDVLEVGAGFGVNIPYFYNDEVTRWLSLEPDTDLCTEYKKRQSEGAFPKSCELLQDTTESLKEDETFDAIIYIDVMEHIEHDRDEFARAYEHLNPGGHLIVLCPAHNFLFSPFDKAIGHFRRYNKRMYRELSNVQPVRLEYLDSVGMAASIANKMLLKQSYPNVNQIKVWDRIFVRCSRIVDPLIFRCWGKSVLGVWEKK